MVSLIYTVWFTKTSCRAGRRHHAGRNRGRGSAHRPGRNQNLPPTSFNLAPAAPQAAPEANGCVRDRGWSRMAAAEAPNCRRRVEPMCRASTTLSRQATQPPPPPPPGYNFLFPNTAYACWKIQPSLLKMKVPHHDVIQMLQKKHAADLKIHILL